MTELSIPDWLLQIISASIGAIISGIVLLLIHHSKVNQEIEKHRKIENFEKKQKAYRKILALLSKMLDYSYFLGKPVNWKIIRQAYNEIMLVGSKDVVEKTNELMSGIGEDGSQETQNKVKNLWNVIRKDLYGEELPLEQMHLITPSQETVNALSLYHQYSDKLKSSGIDTLEKAQDMDLDIVYANTQIDKNDLLAIKKMAKNELTYENEFKKFVDEQ